MVKDVLMRRWRARRATLAVPARHKLQAGHGEPPLELPGHSKQLGAQVVHEVSGPKPQVDACPGTRHRGRQALRQCGRDMAPLARRRRCASAVFSTAWPFKHICELFGAPFFAADTKLIPSEDCVGRGRNLCVSALASSCIRRTSYLKIELHGHREPGCSGGG